MILSLILAAQISIYDPDNVDCSVYGANHTSGIAIAGKRLPVRDIEPLFENVRSPALSLEFTGSAYQRQVIQEFLRVTKGKDRRLQIFPRGTLDLQDQADDLVNEIFKSGQFTEDLNNFNFSEVSLCPRKDDRMTDYQFSSLTNVVRGFWPWFVCRSPKPDRTVKFTAGAEYLNITDWSIAPSVLRQSKYLGLEYSVANTGTKVSTTKLLARFRGHWNTGAISMLVWYQGGRIDKYKKVIETTDRWAWSETPAICRPPLT